MDAATAIRLKYEQECTDCGGKDFVEDHSQGDLVCTSCGLVMESHGIDERSEWRTFGDKDKEGVDPNRVGGPTNHLLSDGGLSTAIGAPTKGAMSAALTQTLQRTQARSTNPDRALQTAFRGIAQLCEKLGLVRSIKDRANEIYKQVSESKLLRGKGTSATHAAVVFIACKQEKMPRTFKEINLAVPDASKKDIARVYKFIVQELEKDMDHALSQVETHPSDFMRRFCSVLRLTNTEMKASSEIADQAVSRGSDAKNDAHNAWNGKSPVSIAAGIIFLVTQLPKATRRVTLQELAGATQMAEATIRQLYKDLLTDVVRLVPAWYATPQEIAALPTYESR